MSTKLIIAEKPSMAKEISFALGGSVKSETGYWRVGEDKLVTYAFGHLFEVAEPKDHNPEWEKWTLESLPMLPDKLNYKPTQSSKNQWHVIKDLINRGEVSSIVNACDAGREGELIFWLIYNHAATDKPVERLWISSLTGEAIRNGFQNLLPAEKFDGLKNAAFCRQEADWLVGLNATRCQTLVARELGAEKQVFPLGRVQTPVLALIVNRDLKIEQFKSTTTWACAATFRADTNITFTAHLIEADKKIKIFDSRTEAEQFTAALSKTGERPFIEGLTAKTVRVKQPLLWDLTGLQREMNAKHGWTAAKTLETAQTLYEKKLVTYPRTSSAYLSTSVYREDVPKILKNLSANGKAKLNRENSDIDDEVTACGRIAEEILNEKLLLTKRHVADDKITDHHAVIPTGNYADSNNTKDELLLYAVIAKRFLAAFFPEGIDEKSEITVKLSENLFLARSRKIIEAGWRRIIADSPATVKENTNEKSEDSSEAGADSEIPEQDITLTKNAALETGAIEVQERKSKPPARYTESSLLGAMETAGKDIEEEDLRQAMKSSGIGTPATRAEIIEKLLKTGYIERKKKSLVSQPKGRAVIEMLGSNILTSAELTGRWEAGLNHIAENKLSPANFKLGVRELTRETVAFIRGQINSDKRFVTEGLGNCPKCRIAGRGGKLKQIVGGADKKTHFLVCGEGREICGYISSLTKKKTFLKKLSESDCPKCGEFLVFRISKTGIPLLSCNDYPNCNGVIWLENKPNEKEKNQIKKV